jgi:hypothetical protein
LCTRGFRYLCRFWRRRRAAAPPVVGDGTVWNAATGRAADGRRLDLVPAVRLYAFARQDDHGPDALLDHSPELTDVRPPPVPAWSGFMTPGV